MAGFDLAVKMAAVKLVDLSRPLAPDMPLYPGTLAPEIEARWTIAADGFLEHRIAFSSHTGTHLDAPAHLLPGGRSLDELPLDACYGRACCLDAPGEPGGRIEVATLEPQRARAAGADFILLRTGWGGRWGRPDYFEDPPLPSLAAAAWLAELGPRLIGIDGPSFDPIGPGPLAVHRLLLGRGILLLENLAGLERLPAGLFRLACFPLKLAGSDGMPVRAVAILEEDGPA